MRYLERVDLPYKSLATCKYGSLHASNDGDTVRVLHDLLDKLHGMTRLMPLEWMDSCMDVGIQSFP